MKTYTAGCAYNNGVGTQLRRVPSLPDKSPAKQALCGTPVPHLAQHWGVTAHAVTQTEFDVCCYFLRSRAVGNQQRSLIFWLSGFVRAQPHPSRRRVMLISRDGLAASLDASPLQRRLNITAQCDCHSERRIQKILPRPSGRGLKSHLSLLYPAGFQPHTQHWRVTAHAVTQTECSVWSRVVLVVTFFGRK
jgi:hypothetical protein